MMLPSDLLEAWFPCEKLHLFYISSFCSTKSFVTFHLYLTCIERHISYILSLITFSSSKRKQKKKIRRILDDAELGEETKRKIAIEKVCFIWLICLVRSDFLPTE